MLLHIGRTDGRTVGRGMENFSNLKAATLRKSINCSASTNLYTYYGALKINGPTQKLCGGKGVWRVSKLTFNYPTCGDENRSYAHTHTPTQIKFIKIEMRNNNQSGKHTKMQSFCLCPKWKKFECADCARMDHIMTSNIQHSTAVNSRLFVCTDCADDFCLAHHNFDQFETVLNRTAQWNIYLIFPLFVWATQ